MVIGKSDTSNMREHAFVYRNGVMTDLNNLVDPALGWELTFASGINDNGWIVGKGINPEGGIRALLLIPTPQKIAIDKIEDAIDEKVMALESINEALEKEEEVIELLKELLASREYGELRRRDIVRTMFRIIQSMKIEYQTKDNLNKSIKALKRSLKNLGWQYTSPTKKPPVVSITNPPDGAKLWLHLYFLDITIEAESWDADGSVLKVEFFADENFIGEDNDASDGWSINWTKPDAGTYILTAKATDNDGMTTTSSPVEIIVTSYNRPPRPPWPSDWLTVPLSE